MLDQKFGWARPVFDAKNDQFWSTKTGPAGSIFVLDQFFLLQSHLFWGDFVNVWQWNQIPENGLILLDNMLEK